MRKVFQLIKRLHRLSSMELYKDKDSMIFAGGSKRKRWIAGYVTPQELSAVKKAVIQLNE